MISGTAHAGSLSLYSNGNDISRTLDATSGIITATSDDESPVAIASYSDGCLVSLSFSSGKDGSIASAVAENEGTQLKVFHFDENMRPYEEAKTITTKNKNYRVFFNETFNGKSNKLGYNDYCTPTSDGQVRVVGNGTRYGGVSIYYPDRYLVIEADYTISENVAFDSGRLLCYYTNSPSAFIFTTASGIYAGKNGGDKASQLILSAADAHAMGKFNLACVLDLENLCFDAYINRVKKTTVPLSIDDMASFCWSGITTYAAYLKPNSAGGYLNEVLIDNYRAYSGREFLDIGEEIQTTHKTDFKNSHLWKSDIYERPEAAEIAKRALETGHPRVLINREKVNQIKNSTDERTKEWLDIVLSNADEALDTPSYAYAISSTDSVQNIPESIDMMMNLGIAYLMTGDKKYSDRAYKEAEVLYTVPYKKYNGELIPEDGRDYWNSYSYLDVGEISFIMALCYDWMYDAWTPAQKKELTDNIMQKGLIRSFRALMGYLNPTNAGSNGWHDSQNNWNAVCNGGVMMSAIAFMECDPYLCGEVAEATIRAFEYMLASYAPAGAWAEGAGYWNYALKYLSASCATLDAACGSDFGISKTVGLQGSQLYSISLEGKTGVMNYGDGGSSRVNAPFMFYWADKYNDKDIGGAALYIKEVFGYEPSAFDLIYYNPESVVENYTPPTAFYYPGTEVVSITPNHDPLSPYISISGGLGKATNHDHLDSGGVVLEMKGKRLFYDIGAEHYGAAGYFSTNRFLYFRARPEGHSTFIINPEVTSDGDGNVYYGQKVEAYSAITNYDPVGKSATMDLSDAYSRDASMAKRTISVDENTAVIADSITLKKESNVYWNWYINTSAKNITISADGKSATVNLSGTKYNISFDVSCDYSLYVEDADYYVNVDPDVGGRKHKNNDFKRLVLKLENATGTVNVKTIVK